MNCAPGALAGRDLAGFGGMGPLMEGGPFQDSDAHFAAAMHGDPWAADFGRAGVNHRPPPMQGHFSQHPQQHPQQLPLQPWAAAFREEMCADAGAEWAPAMSHPAGLMHSQMPMQMPMPMMHMAGMPMMTSHHHHHHLHHHAQAVHAQPMAAVAEPPAQESVAQTATEDVPTFGLEGQAVQSTEEKTANSEFYAFMNKINTGELVIDDEKGVIEGPGPSHGGDWAAELAAAQAMVDADAGMDGPQALDNEADAAAEAEAMERAWGSEQGDPYSQEFFDGDFEPTQWAEEYTQMLDTFNNAQRSTDYPFDPENHFLFHENPFEEGLQLLDAGILSEAVLAFEAACQQEPERQDAWRLLGTTQAENEKDSLAIRALNRARELRPGDKEAYMALAVSHTNEGNNMFAVEALRGWLLAQPDYEPLAGVIPKETPTIDNADDDLVNNFLAAPAELDHVRALFEAAAELNANDADLFVGLGIVAHLGRDFDAAATNFQQALERRPADPKLWNKLGATLANGARSREALGAYDRALDLNPGYVRAQYNMGVAHNNLGEHALAAKSFVRAIMMQQGGPVQAEAAAPPRSTREMWDALRMALNLMNRADLVEQTWSKDLHPFLATFGINVL